MNRGALVLVLAANFFAATLAGGLSALCLAEPSPLWSPAPQANTATKSPALAEVQKTFTEGEAALQRGELETAEAAFRMVLAADPRSGAAYANLGVIAMRRKDWDHALSLLQKAERLEPKMAGIRLDIGLIKYRSADYAGAIAPLASVVRDQPESQQARYLLGLCDVFTEHYADAVAALEPLWSRQSNDFMYLYVLGIAAHNANQKELNEKALSRLVEIGGNKPEFRFDTIDELGVLSLGHATQEAAIEQAKRIIDIREPK